MATNVPRWILLAVLVFSGLVLSACKSTPKPDWNSRIGNYTYDQAVTELGPPDKSANLTDGKIVAEWVERRRSGGFSVGFGVGSYGSHGGVGVGQSIGVGPGDKVLRLVFGPDNRLVSWSKD